MHSQEKNPCWLTRRYRLVLVIAFALALGVVLATGATVFAAHNLDRAPVTDGGSAPNATADFSLMASYKIPSRPTLANGETLTYTIYLRNSSAATVTAVVTDPIAAKLAYVPGSATGGGVYNSADKTLSWSAVNVPAHGVVPLSFQVAPSSDITMPVPVMNNATIAAGTTSFQRQAWILLVPSNRGMAHLMGSYKAASKYVVGPGGALTYTIRLHNSSNTDMTAHVVDSVPMPLTYVSGSASGGGQFDAATATLTWNAVTVPGGDSVSLTYGVHAPAEVITPTIVTNVATITVPGGSFQRQACVLLRPQASSEDSISPVVHGVTIDDQDVLTSPTVTLHISATDNISVTRMYVREWVLGTKPSPRWQIVHSSGWVPYQADYPWTLTSDSGTHFVGVWVADAASNVSHSDRRAFDFASLLLPGTSVDKFGMVPYLVHYEAGVPVTAVLTPTTGDVDLYAWYPGNMGQPNHVSTNTLTTTEVISFTTPQSGTYLFLAYRTAASTYDLSIVPGGGPHASSSALVITGQVIQADSNPVVLTGDPVLPASGVDPLEDAAPPSIGNMIYLPLVKR